MSAALTRSLNFVMAGTPAFAGLMAVDSVLSRPAIYYAQTMDKPPDFFPATTFAEVDPLPDNRFFDVDVDWQLYDFRLWVKTRGGADIALLRQALDDLFHHTCVPMLPDIDGRLNRNFWSERVPPAIPSMWDDQFQAFFGQFRYRFGTVKGWN